MKKSSVSSRRKFLTGMGIAAGAAALAPAVKTLGLPCCGGKSSLLNAWTSPAANYRPHAGLTQKLLMEPKQKITRAAGSHLLPLSQRPF
jgi:hypothetical protein